MHTFVRAQIHTYCYNSLCFYVIIIRRVTTQYSSQIRDKCPYSPLLQEVPGGQNHLARLSGSDRHKCRVLRSDSAA